MKRIHVSTHKKNEAIDITSLVQNYLVEIKAASGVLMVQSPHTTASVTINENADPDVKFDILNHLTHLVPPSDTFAHVEGNSDAHIKASLVGSTAVVIVEEGQLRLGTWQAIFLMEFDGPREREVWLKFLKD